MKKACLIAAGLALLLAGGIQVKLIAREQNEKQPAKAPRASAEARLKAAEAVLETAKQTSELTTAEYDEGTVTLTEVYVWSRRWLDAQRALAKNQEEGLNALRDHLKRMQRLLRITKALRDSGARGGEEQKLRAMRYYVAEVELWIIDAGGEPPRDPQ